MGRQLREWRRQGGEDGGDIPSMGGLGWDTLKSKDKNKRLLTTIKDYCITGRANLIFCAVGLR